MARPPAIYAVYFGDRFAFMGTLDEIEREYHINKVTLRFYASKKWLEKQESFTFKGKDSMILVNTDLLMGDEK